MQHIPVDSPLWRLIERHLQDRLSRCRERNDSGRLDPIETALLRGEISAIKDLLGLPEHLVTPTIHDDPGYGTHSLDG